MLKFTVIAALVLSQYASAATTTDKGVTKAGTVSLQIKGIDLHQETIATMWQICSPKLADSQQYLVKFAEREVRSTGHMTNNVEVVASKQRQPAKNCLHVYLELPLMQQQRIEWSVELLNTETTLLTDNINIDVRLLAPQRIPVYKLNSAESE